MKVALVCDWLTNIGGAEKVLLEFHKLFPDAPIYTSKYDKKGIDWFDDATVKTGWLQFFPTNLRRFLGPLRQIYFSRLDLSDYDVVISVTGAEAKSVKTGKAVHFCYCHMPTQYYWGMYNEYVKNPGFGFLNPLVRFFLRILVKRLRRADQRAAKKPDYFITISEYAKEQIKKYYNRNAKIIYPNVEIDKFKNAKSFIEDTAVIADSFIITSRQVNWKRIDLAIRACMQTQQKLIVVGEGPDHKNLVEIAKNSQFIRFYDLMKTDELARYLKTAKGFIFPSLEPFGIAPIEAIAAGCPVIAYGAGGALDYIQDGKNGILFEKQTVKSLAEAIEKFSSIDFKNKKIAETVTNFNTKRFDKEIKDFINEKIS